MHLIPAIKIGAITTLILTAPGIKKVALCLASQGSQ